MSQQESIPPELLQAMSAMMASAFQATLANMGAEPNNTENSTTRLGRPPPFTMTEFQSNGETLVADYFKRFQWALELSKIPSEQYSNYARVHMGSELNNALKFLVSPRPPESISYQELQTILISHFDQARNKYAESIRFRQITQHEGETIAAFTLRLRQGAAHCEYGEFLDRMLIEQLLHGLESRDVCDEIVAKKPNTFVEAFDIANTLEATHKTTNAVQNSGATQEATNKLGYASPKMKCSKEPYHRTAPRGMRQRENYQETTGKRESTERRAESCCHGCGGQHDRNKCRFRSTVCNACGKRGHLARVCRSSETPISTIESRAIASSQTTEVIDTVRMIDKVNFVHPCKKYIVDVDIDGKIIPMEIDSGAPYGIISDYTLRSIKPNFLLKRVTKQFISYTGHQIPCIGCTTVNVTIGKTSKKLKAFVVKGRFDSLLGREWISHFVHEIDFKKLASAPEAMHMLNTTAPRISQAQEARLNQLLKKHEDIFSLTTGTLTGPPISLHLKADAAPIFARAREIPVALRDKYAQEIDAKIKSGFYKRVEFSEWASTTHVVTKKNGKLRITGNYKPTVNPRIIVDEHPIPKAEHIFSTLKGARIFCHLDITDAYSHLVLDEESGHVLTLNTPTHGLIRPTRAVYGAANIPAVWQRRMETILQDLPNVKNFYDDLLLFAEDFESLLQVLDTTLIKLKEQGLRLNRSKCVFATPSVEFLGHKIDAQGVHKSDKHIEAIKNAPKPSTPEELQLFLGKASYYSAFIPDLSTRNRPLRDMLHRNPFEWTQDATTAFEDIKEILSSPQVLTPYDPTKPLILATDASKIGLGAVLSHKCNNGQERPIAYASRTMSETEQRYPQVDKEALAIVWAVNKFFYYLYARHFTLVTDHKPLTQILHPEKTLPTLCISRMANYADYLSHFNFDVIFKPTTENKNADYYSRMPLIAPRKTVQRITIKEKEEIEYDGFDHFVLHQIKQLPMTAENIAKESEKDPKLGKIMQHLKTGQDLFRLGYRAPESNYGLGGGCLVFEHRVVIPPIFRRAVLDELHTAHLGIVKMKGMARSFIYWPGMDYDIEQIAKTCVDCARNAHEPPKARDHHWEYPKKPWERIHIDYAGPVAGKMLLIIVDAYSKWLEVKITNSTTTQATISMLEELLAAYGAPITIVLDNGPQFTAKEFKEFLQKAGVKYHKRIAPYHPSTNGQAERYVQTVKDALKNMSTTPGSLHHNVHEFLRQYRKAPHASTDQSPAQLFLGRTIRTRLDLVRPDEDNVKVSQKQQASVKRACREFQPSQMVYFLSGNPRIDKWIPGQVRTRLGSLHYEIEYQGRIYKRHVDQIRNRRTRRDLPNSPFDSGRKTKNPRRVKFYGNFGSPPTISPQRRIDSPTPNVSVRSDRAAASETSINSPQTEHRANTLPLALRKSVRLKRPPQRFMFDE